MDEVEIHHLHNEPLAQWLTANVEAGTVLVLKHC
ncbi:creatinase [Enterobacter cloacae]|uniref:Creatinase n=1 Tax=Enterobacter cloacae TaxID=550 RepID=A0A377LY84_ENTCL|nr:creatinase [Enterobacter cloacae]